MAAGGSASLGDILSRYGLERKDLEQTCPESVRLEVAEELSDDWKMVGHYLGFSVRHLNDIQADNTKEEHRRVALLDSWRQREGTGATYLKLAEAVHRRKRIDLAEMICHSVRVALGGANISINRDSERMAASKGNRMLTMDNFAAVLSAVWPARSQYYNLGLALQVSANDLDAIQKSNAYRVDECFTDMLKLILRGTEGLSQDALADALGSNTVGFGSLACDIRSMTF